MRHLCVFACVMAVLACGGTAQACEPPGTMPALRVDLRVDPPRVDHSRSRDKLQSVSTATESPYAPGAKVHVNGVMRGAVTLETKSTLAWQKTPDRLGGNKNCFWFDGVTLVMKLSPTIYIARELKKGSCLYNEVAAHEYRHFAIDQEIAQNYKIAFQDMLKDYLQRVPFVGPYPDSQKKQAQNALSTQLEAEIKKLHDRMKADRIKYQATIDTLEEYERVARTCPDYGQQKPN
jgi:hypothetical protein